MPFNVHSIPQPFMSMLSGINCFFKVGVFVLVWTGEYVRMFDCECTHFSAFVYTLFGAQICFYSLESLYCFYHASRSHLVIHRIFGYVFIFQFWNLDFLFYIFKII